jgi:alanine-alpha-ketoisovalerate/valine-pyruvate aminotransferase
MTLEEEFKKSEVGNWILHNGEVLGDIPELTDWFKSYLKDVLQSVKLKEKQYPNPQTKSGVLPAVSYVVKDREAWGYNQALSDQEAKIREELTKRGI